MVVIQGLGGTPEPKSDRTDRVRDERAGAAQAAAGASAGTAAKDDLSISSEAKAAAEVGRIAQLTKAQDEIRAERVEAAREKIERGDYKDPEVVAEVAKRLMKFFS